MLMLYTLYEGLVSASVERRCGAGDEEYVQFLSGFVTSQWVPSHQNGTFRLKECSAGEAQQIFPESYCFTVHFNSLILSYQLMHFYIQ